MAINSGLTDSFKQEILEGVHDLSSDSVQVFKIALFTNDATLNTGTTAYSATDEVSSANYTAGGAILSLNGVTVSNHVAYVDFADVTWSTVTFASVRGALIYNDSVSDKSICVLDFGVDKTITSADFTVKFPTADSNDAIIRIN